MNNLYEFNIDVYLPLDQRQRIAATKMDDIPKNMQDVDPAAITAYYDFVECVEEIFDYYEFECVKSRNSGLSYYYYYAHKTQIEADNVPKYIKVRISSHPEKHKSNEHKNKLKEQTRKELEEIKRPKSKIEQRYMPVSIVADNQVYDTYEQLLDETEVKVRKLVTSLGISLDRYDSIGPFES